MDRYELGDCDGPGIATNEANIDWVNLTHWSGGQNTNSTACME
jgi:hypothetical protein